MIANYQTESDCGTARGNPVKLYKETINFVEGQPGKCSSAIRGPNAQHTKVCSIGTQREFIRSCKNNFICFSGAAAVDSLYNQNICSAVLHSFTQFYSVLHSSTQAACFVTPVAFLQ